MNDTELLKQRVQDVHREDMKLTTKQVWTKINSITPISFGRVEKLMKQLRKSEQENQPTNGTNTAIDIESSTIIHPKEQRQAKLDAQVKIKAEIASMPIEKDDENDPDWIHRSSGVDHSITAKMINNQLQQQHGSFNVAPINIQLPVQIPSTEEILTILPPNSQRQAKL